ncbi:MAG: ABC transporter permease subunit [Fibrobacterales bacterium]
MKQYILRRLLIMIPTILGISIICFALIQFVPGGPVEQEIAKMRNVDSQKGMSASQTITEEEIENLKEYYGFDKPAYIRYFTWIGNVLTLDFGDSYAYEEPVLDVIVSKFPVSIFFGVTSFLLSYIICIPLGLAKAMRHGSLFDLLSSLVIFSGYVVPGYALGIVLIIFLGGGEFFDLFPISGMVSDDFESMAWYMQVLDFLHHMILPLICYMVSQFAFLTLLMKNAILEEISKDYMKTAMVKGASHRVAVIKHALRNALIPLATGMGDIFMLIFSGAILIEKVFDIDGMGLLMFDSMVGRDYTIVMAMIFIMSILTLLGRLFSDVLYVIIDPRVSFSK